MDTKTMKKCLDARDFIHKNRGLESKNLPKRAVLPYLRTLEKMRLVRYKDGKWFCWCKECDTRAFPS